MKNKNGFTLIELLVVVLIIGILTAIVLPQYRMAVLKSKYAAMKIYAESLYKSMQVYYLKTGSWGNAKIEDLDIDIPGEIKSSRPLEIFIPTFRKPIITCRLWYDGNGRSGKVLCDGYGLRYGHNFQNSNTRFCYPLGSNDDLANKLCHNETGDTPTGLYYYYD